LFIVVWRRKGPTSEDYNLRASNVNSEIGFSGISSKRNWMRISEYVQSKEKGNFAAEHSHHPKAGIGIPI